MLAQRCDADPRALLELALRVPNYGRGEVLDMILIEVLLKHLMYIQRSDIGYEAELDGTPPS